MSGATALVQNKLHTKYLEDFKNLRMSKDHFNYLLQRISHFVLLHARTKSFPVEIRVLGFEIPWKHLQWMVLVIGGG